VVTADVVTDRESGESRGFGFVVFADAEAVQEAIDAMDQQVCVGMGGDGGCLVS
jgi:RNA recognition motif-containing protein